MSAILNTPDATVPTATLLQDLLQAQWRAATQGDPSAAAQWNSKEGRGWAWGADGMRFDHSGEEWSAVAWAALGSSQLSALKNCTIELSVYGNADAAGFSFGPYKDFLVPVNPESGARKLQLEVDCEARRWAFRCNGELMHRQWWDSGIKTFDDLLAGSFTLKARRPRKVLFHDFAIRLFETSCQLSIIITCHRFGHRLRVSLRNWCNQTMASGAFEVLVVNPGSPDGVHELMAAVANSHPHVRVREVSVPGSIANNKGAMINRAVEKSSSPWIWLTDADCLFPLDAAQEVLGRIKGSTNRVFFGQRRYLSSSGTDALISGRIDGVSQFSALLPDAAARAPENLPWGYTQIAHRSVFERVKYSESQNHFAHSDGSFIEDCRRRGISTQQLQGLYCLHLDHPFAWFGTNIFL